MKNGLIMASLCVFMMGSALQAMDVPAGKPWFMESDPVNTPERVVPSEKVVPSDDEVPHGPTMWLGDAEGRQAAEGLLAEYMEGIEGIENEKNELNWIVNKRDHYGRTPLMSAAHYGRIGVCELLIDKGADVNARDFDGQTALMLAASNGHGEVCKLLIDKGADVNAQNKSLVTVLEIVARTGYGKICKLLIDAGVDVVNNRSGYRALEYAADSGHRDVCILLIDAILKAYQAMLIKDPRLRADLADINLTPKQKSKVIALMASLKKSQMLKKAGQGGAEGAEHLQADTIKLMGQALSEKYKLINIIQAEIETFHSPLKQELLNYLNGF